VVAAGAVPLSMPTRCAEFRPPVIKSACGPSAVAREQLICGTQVHIGVEDRDESVLVAGRLACSTSWITSSLRLPT